MSRGMRRIQRNFVFFYLMVFLCNFGILVDTQQLPAVGLSSSSTATSATDKLEVSKRIETLQTGMANTAPQPPLVTETTTILILPTISASSTGHTHNGPMHTHSELKSSTHTASAVYVDTAASPRAINACNINQPIMSLLILSAGYIVFS
ncbi:hypothetical protein K7432_008665 [Basidiobolus ranarum]|uniref:Uncharacterized protein n=1 Tax=Basidiobolus ranarum TaxID=34480 RepID=A0ABR2WRK8_9FUNG